MNTEKQLLLNKLSLRHSAYCFAEQHSLYYTKLKPNIFFTAHQFYLRVHSYSRARMM